jgi:hypothetical protein
MKNCYQLTFYNSGGYKDSETVSCHHEIILINGVIEVYKDGELVGGENFVENLLTDTRGWKEECCILTCKKI